MSFKISQSTMDYIHKMEESVKKDGEAFSNLEYYGRLILLKFFQDNGLFLKPGESVSIKEITEKLSIIPKFEKLLNALMLVLKKLDVIETSGETVRVTATIQDPSLTADLKSLETYKKNLLTRYPDMIAHINLLERSIGSYQELFQGTKTPDEILFPVFSLEYVEGIFKGYRLADYFNVLMGRIAVDYIQLIQRPVRILEIGAGSGSTSEFVFDMIKDLPGCEYLFTDVSRVFTKKAERKLSGEFPFVQFRQLDAEKNLKEQGVEDATVDVVIASNVVHATRNVGQTLGNLLPAMKKGGILLLNEVTESQDFVTLTFGMMDGWWRFEDTEIRLPETPLISMISWKKILNASGFTHPEQITTSFGGKKDSFAQSVILAEKP